MFNFYMHRAQLLLFQMGEPLVTILSRERVTQVDPLSMVLYSITLVPLAKEVRAADPGLLFPFYADDAEFGGLVGAKLGRRPRPLRVLDPSLVPEPRTRITVT